METFTIRPRGGAYRIEAVAEDGARRLVATYPTEDAAVAQLRKLQEKSGMPDPAQRQPRDWRL